MNEDNPRPTGMNRVYQEAADWVVLHDKGLTAEQQDAFFQWLAENSRHGEAFADTRQSWSDFNLLAQWRPEHSDEPNPDLLATIKPVRSWKTWGISCGLAAALALFAFVWMGQSEP